MQGAGTQSNPFIISTPQDLNNVRNNLTAYYELANDIDMSSFGNFIPIGKVSPYFRGYLDGKGYKIKNLTINETTGYVGLFGNIANDSSYVKNLALEDCNISGGDIANWCGSISGGLNHGTIENCYATGTLQGKYMVGGLVGQFPYGTIKNCYANVNVTGFGRVGGLVGYSTTTNSIVENCYANGITVHTETGTAYPAGGLIGDAVAITVTNSYWDIQSSGLTYSEGGTGKTTAEMKTQSTYTGWDFNNTWGINGDYPYLQVFGVPIPPAKIGNVDVKSYVNNFFSNLEKSIKLTKQVNVSIPPIVSDSKRYTATSRIVPTYLSQLETNAIQSHRTVRSSTNIVTTFINPISAIVERKAKTYHNLLAYVSPVQAHTDVLYPLNTNVYNAYLNVLKNRSVATYSENTTNLSILENPSYCEVI